MKVVLTETVKKLGSVGDVVNVSPGFARNFIIPNKFGILADEGNEKSMSDKKKMLENKMAEEKNRAIEIKNKIEGLTLNLTKKVGGNGRLFGTVTASEVSNALEKEGFDVEKRMINIETPIKTLGEFEIQAKIFQDVEANFKVNVEMDPKQIEELEKKAKLAKASKKAQAEAAAKAKAEAASEEKSEENAEETTTEE